LQTIIFKQPCDEAIVERQLATLIPPVFDYLEQELEQELEGEMRDDRWLVGDAFGIADLSIGSMFVSLRHAKESVDHARWPRLGAYVDRVHARPSLAALIAEEEASLASL
jgi:glutathione S-transferase